MGKITYQCFLLIFILFGGWHLHADNQDRKDSFDNVFQQKLFESNLQNEVLNELTAFLHSPDYVLSVNAPEVLEVENIEENLACQNPIVSTTNVCDVNSSTYMVTVNVQSMGSASTVVIEDNVGGPIQTLSSPGTVTVGPFPYDVDVTLTVSDQDDPDCKVTTELTSNNCPPPFCTEAEPFCSDEDLEFPNTTNTGQAPDGPDYACFSSQPNPVWYYLRVGEPGAIEILIEQHDENGTLRDVDFVMWGPFDSLEDGCGEVMGGVAPVQFSYSASGTETIGIGTQGGGTLGACDGTSTPPMGQTGDIYIVMLTNYSNASGTISLTQVSGDGSTDCSIVYDNEVLACHGEEVLLEVEYPSDIDTYVWYYYDPQTDDYIAIDDEFGDSILVDESGQYKVDVFDAEGGFNTEIFTVVISPEVETDLEDEMSLCGVDSVELDGTVINPDDYAGIQYIWTDENGEEVGDSAVITVTEPGVYTLEITTGTVGSEGFETEEVCVTTIEVVVGEADFDVDAGEDQIVCGIDSVELEVEIEGDDASDATFTWFNEAGEVVGDQQTVTVTETGEYTIEVSMAGCVGTDTVYVEINDLPEFDLGNDIVTCSLEDVVIEVILLNMEPSDETVFEWTYNGEIIDYDGMALNASDYGYGEYSVTVYEGSEECSTTQYISVNEIEDFGVTLEADNDLNGEVRYCEDLDETGEDYEITFTATPTGVDAGEVEFAWYQNDNLINGANESTYTVVYDSEGEYNDVFTVEISVGSCVATASLTTDVYFGPEEHPCIISEGISPSDQDGKNDTWDLTFISNRSGIAKLTIYNRYGTKVYDKVDYSNQWYGQSNKGKDLTTGTYYYVMEFKNEDPVFGKVKKGWVYVQ